jgi:hypothetical protein
MGFVLRDYYTHQIGPLPRTHNNMAYVMVENAKETGAGINFNEFYEHLWFAANWIYAYSPPAVINLESLSLGPDDRLSYSTKTIKPKMSKREYYSHVQGNVENAVVFARQTINGINRRFNELKK